jgi:hypothetical protein
MILGGKLHLWYEYIGMPLFSYSIATDGFSLKLA